MGTRAAIYGVLCPGGPPYPCPGQCAHQYSAMGMTDETPDDVMHSVCYPTMPKAGKIWDGVVEKPGEWSSKARESIILAKPISLNQ